MTGFAFWLKRRGAERVIVEEMRRRYPTASRTQCLRWHAEDFARAEQSRIEGEAYAEFARDVLRAAGEGVDVSALWSCPDLTGLAMERRR